MSQFLDLVRSRPVFYDGSMGATILNLGLTPEDYGGQATEGYNDYLSVVKPDVIEQIHARTGETVNIMTHCNAGWLAFVRHGTATAPMYAAHAAGIPIHVYVSETRPRNQGARLTAWELHQAGVPLTLVADNAAGHLLQRGMVDMVIVGSDRTTIAGDVANKIGTYMKAVLAKAHGVPFYAALPSSTLASISSA